MINLNGRPVLFGGLNTDGKVVGNVWIFKDRNEREIQLKQEKKSFWRGEGVSARH